MTHTKEPWAYVVDEDGEDCIQSGDGKFWIAKLYGCPGPTDETPEANARRIVACVNACQGISTEELEAYKRVDFLSDGLAALTYKQQRDELLAIAKQALALHPDWLAASAAIAKVKS